MAKKPCYTREEFGRIYKDVKNMRKTGTTISDCCYFSEITVNKFNYYSKKYGFDSLKEPKYPYDTFKELYDDIVSRVKNGMTITEACRYWDVKLSTFYKYIKFHNMHDIIINDRPEYDYDEIY